MFNLDENVPPRAPGDPDGSIFAPIVDPRSKDNTNTFPLDGVDIDRVSDADLIQLADTAPLLYQIGTERVLRVSRHLVLKCGGYILPSEVNALELVAAKTSIRVPRVHRSFQVSDSSQRFGTKGYFVMDYIDGENLGDCWKHLTTHQKQDVVTQTVAMIKQLQDLVIPTAGPIGGGPCRGRFFTVYSAGPFSSAADMEAWFNHKLTICKHYNKAPKDLPPFKFTKFVLVHQDISPRNMILDASGQVWLIDWADSGAYPPAFERAALADQPRFPEFNGMMLERLPKQELEEQLQSIAYGLTVASFA
ncbi:predicted protein [Uncinocarpus reesii 1704]|uniref:Aminoglycoside phosphotransferase domain-containing protein n=1 Tax=Uncinocarpus reesii (strain UAMH 1704) TaxID=336963 RepID=C4JQ32_UNCRE|nr:uncharacterized protein UREG_03265 [Uncinocarpus reesii 1704]EEP78419.1 predicted protein [Uncinocarpus reesii 1704]